jgi:hypothetical protein
MQQWVGDSSVCSLPLLQGRGSSFFQSPPLAAGVVGAGGALARDGIGGRFGWWSQWGSWVTARIDCWDSAGWDGSALPTAPSIPEMAGFVSSIYM